MSMYQCYTWNFRSKVQPYDKLMNVLEGLLRVVSEGRLHLRRTGNVQAGLPPRAVEAAAGSGFTRASSVGARPFSLADHRPRPLATFAGIVFDYRSLRAVSAPCHQIANTRSTSLIRPTRHAGASRPHAILGRVHRSHCAEAGNRSEVNILSTHRQRNSSKRGWLSSGMSCIAP